MLLANRRQICFCVVCFLGALMACATRAQSPNDGVKHFSKNGLEFEYAANWELNAQESEEAHQLVLTEKALDAQIMIIGLHSPITSAKDEEAAKHAVVEPMINRLLKQYDDAGIKVDRAPLSGEVAASPAQGLQLRFTVDGQPGTTDILWLVLNKRLVQLIFIRPEKTETQTIPCWNLVRRTLKFGKA